MKRIAANLSRKLAVAAAAALFALTAASPSGAALGRWDRLSFSGPVALPGVVLPRGSYTFEIANPDSSQTVVRVSHRETRRVYFAGFTSRVARPRGLGTDELVVFGEAPAGGAPPITVWYPSGRSDGHRFIYR